MGVVVRINKPSINRAIRNAVRDTAGNVMLAVDAALVLNSPVDTGRLRSNWLPSLDGPAFGEVPEESVDKAGTAGQALVASTAQALPEYPHAFITNNVPYVEAVNEKRPFVSDSVKQGLDSLS